MKLSKRVNYLNFLFLIVLSIFFRAGYIYPHSGDAWSNIAKVSMITRQSELTYYLHPLSYFGWFPFSYPSGEWLLLSAVSQTSGVHIVNFTWVISGLFGIFGIFAFYILVKCFSDDDLFILMALLIYSTIQTVVYRTWNDISSRGLFTMLWPCLLYMFILSKTDQKHRYLFIPLSIFTLITLASLHRIIVYFILNIIIPFILFAIADFAIRRTKIKVPEKFVTVSILVTISIIFALQMMNRTIVDLSKTANVIERIVPGNNPISRLINVGSTYGKYYGLIALFVPIGAIDYVVKKEKLPLDYLIILITIVGTFFILDVQYFRYFFPPMTAIIAANGTTKILKIMSEQNWILGAMIILITVFTSSQYLYYYVTHTILSPTLLTFIGFGLAIFGFKRIHGDGSEKSFLVILIGIMMLPTSYVLATGPCRAIDLFHEQENGEGKIVDQNHGFDNALWTSEYIQGNFMSEVKGTVLGITGISGLASYDSFLNISHDEKLIIKLETTFNHTLLFNSEDTFYDVDLEVRFNPQKLQKQVFVHGDSALIETSELNFIIFFSDTSILWYNLYNYKIVSLLEEKYILYSTSLISIYHNDYYS
jgi:hypothetical protein